MKKKWKNGIKKINEKYYTICCFFKKKNSIKYNMVEL